MKYKIIVIMAMALAAFATTACHKERNCRCTITEHDEHNTISNTNNVLRINVDDIKCENITTVGDEWIDHDGFVHSNNKVSCSEE